MVLKKCVENEKDKKKDLMDDNLGWKFWKKRRYIIGLLLFFTFFISYIFQVTINISIVKMNSSTEVGVFKWSSMVQNYILASFYYALPCNQFLGGWMSAIIGGKKIIGCGITVATLLTILTPLATELSVYLLISLRITMGFFLGMTYPAIYSIWLNWAPINERTRLTSLTLSGSLAAAVVGVPLAGLITNYLNWQLMFYVFGLFGVVCSILWWLIVEDKPEDYSKITSSELDYINQSLDSDYKKKKISHPWKEILTSPSVWAIIVAHFCESWGYQMMITQLPILLASVFKYHVSLTGLQMAIFHFILMIVTIIGGQLADWFITKNHLTTTMVRKVFICGALFVQTIFIVSAGYVTSSTFIIIYSTLAISIGAFVSVNLNVNYLDIAPQHASVLFGISHTIGTIPVIISPILTGFIVKQMNCIESWTIMFIIGGIISITGCIIYGLFGSGEIQKWAVDSNGIKTNDECEKEKIKLEKVTCL